MTTKVSYCKNTTYLVLFFVKSLPWLFNRNLLTDIKISFYHNIAILCAKMSRVNWALVKKTLVLKSMECYCNLGWNKHVNYNDITCRQGI